MMKQLEEIPESGDTTDGNQAFRHDIVNKK
jgi:hypothetical protein